MRAEPEAFPRDESVESTNGGFGLYYRTPMIAFGLVAPAGTALGEDTVTPIDVLSRREQASDLADEFQSAISDTTCFERIFTTTDPIPVGVIDEYAEVACLCRLDYLPTERASIADAILSPAHPEDVAGVEQRRRSIAHCLTLVDHDPDVVDDDSSQRQPSCFPRLRTDRRRHNDGDDVCRHRCPSGLWPAAG